MEEENWGEGYSKSLGIFLNGETIPNPNPRRGPRTDDSFYVILNAHFEPLTFTLPGKEWGQEWVKELDTQVGWVIADEILKARAELEIGPRSLMVLRRAT